MATKATKKKGAVASKSKKAAKPAKARIVTGPVCVECEVDGKGVSNRIVGRVIRAGQVPRELLVMRMLCEPCLMQEDGKRKS